MHEPWLKEKGNFHTFNWNLSKKRLHNRWCAWIRLTPATNGALKHSEAELVWCPSRLSPTVPLRCARSLLSFHQRDSLFSLFISWARLVVCFFSFCRLKLVTTHGTFSVEGNPSDFTSPASQLRLNSQPIPRHQNFPNFATLPQRAHMVRAKVFQSYCGVAVLPVTTLRSLLKTTKTMFCHVLMLAAS